MAFLPSDRIVEAAATGRLHADPERVPACELAIVPGARVDGESVSAALEDRLEAARRLLLLRRVPRVLVSGSGDEVRAMSAWLAREGVPESAVLVDPRGLRTRLTMEHAAGAFAARSAIVCSNAFHLPRCIFLARAAGIDAYGLVADRRDYQRATRAWIRERFACARAVLEMTATGRAYPDS